MVPVNKRLLKELRQLTLEQRTKPLLENNYLVAFDEQNLSKVFVIIKGPQDSLYRHKFIRLNFDIPENYPHVPPKVSFVNYDGSRIHPTMYECGKCCCTILNTWPSLESESNTKLEAWTSSFGIETIILTFLSFLDNKPYTYEAGAPDNETYNTYVLFKSWSTCLTRYIEDRNAQPELFNTFISNYLLLNISNIMDDLDYLSKKYPPNVYSTNCFYIEHYNINYTSVINKLAELYNFIDYKENLELDENDIGYLQFINQDYKCNICFDTLYVEKTPINLSCTHSFHIDCLKLHIKNNSNICSLCRTDINIKDLEVLQKIETETTWIINPDTKRKVKVGSKTYKRLKIDKVID